MVSNERSGSGYTPPKGKQTISQGDTEERGRRIPASVEWMVVGVVLVGLLVAAFIFATERDIPSRHTGAPAPVVEQLIIDQI